jgi:uncharacterized protein YlxW (UPF0749 family)
MTRFHFSRQHIVLFFTAFLFGIFFIIQARSFGEVASIATRDAQSNVFREIQILHTTNKALSQEVSSLEQQLHSTRDRSTSLQALENEIKRYQLLDGSTAVSGSGVTLLLPDGTQAVSLLDLVNELFTLGAEALSINDVRLTTQTLGFEQLPQNKILMNNIILTAPYKLEVIGDSENLYESLLQPGGFIQRFRQSHKGLKVVLDKQSRIIIEKLF